MAGRPYTTKELQRLRAMTREGMTAAECAEALGRSASSVHQTRNRYGMSRRQIAQRSIPALREDIRRLNARGWSDPDIAAKWNVDHRTVGLHRRALGLPSNKTHARQRAKTRKAYRRQLRTDGIAHLGEYRHQRWRQHAIEHGWPPECRPNEVTILNALAEGPKTTWQLAALLGRSHWKRVPLKDGHNDTYTGRLIRMGLVKPVGRARPRGRGRGETIYALAPAATRTHLRDQPKASHGALLAEAS